MRVPLSSNLNRQKETSSNFMQPSARKEMSHPIDSYNHQSDQSFDNEDITNQQTEAMHVQDQGANALPATDNTVGCMEPYKDGMSGPFGVGRYVHVELQTCEFEKI
jgi:hypothetical protein